MATFGAVPTDDYTRYSRIVLVLGKSCTEVERKVLEAFLSYTNQTPDQFLLHNKTTILTKRNGKHNQRVYFPCNQTADLQKWDLGAVCFILTDFTTVPQQQKDDICHLRRIRNEICHCSSPDLSETDYLSHKDDIQKIIDRALSYVNDSGFRQHIEKQVKEIEQGAFSAAVQDSLQQLNTWYEVVEELKADNETTHQKLDELLWLLRANIAHKEFPVDLEMQNCTEDQETSLTKLFISQFHNSIKGTKLGKRLADEDIDDLNEAIYDTCKKLKLDGKTVKTAMPQCVRLTISCSSIENLLSLIEDCASGRLTELFEPIETAVRKLPGFADYRQQVVMYRQDYVACVYNIVKYLCASVSLMQIRDVPTAKVTHVGRSVIRLTIPVNKEPGEVHDLVEDFMALSKAIQVSFQDHELKLEIDKIADTSKPLMSSTHGEEYESVTFTPLYENKPAIDKQSSAEDFQNCCDRCDGDGKRAEASGYCKQCREYLCKTCIQLHDRNQLNRLHEFLEGDKIPPKHFPPQHDDATLIEFCRINSHTKHIIKFYCQYHGVIACEKCRALFHRNCKIDYIEDASRGFRESRELNDLLASIRHLERQIEDFDNTIKETSKSNTEVKQTALDSIREFRAEILAYFDKREQELVTEIETMKAEDDNLLANIKSQSEDLTKKLQEIKQEIESNLEVAKKLFISAKERMFYIKEMNNVLANSSKEVKTRRRDYIFNRDMTVEEIMSSRRPLGKLDSHMVFTRRDLVKARWIRRYDIDTRSSEDKNKCNISGMRFLSPGVVVLADSGNNATKVLDTTEKKVISRLNMSNKPYDLTILLGKQVAVTMPDEQKIQILAAHNNKLSKLREFNVSGPCRGIDYKLDQLAVIYFKPVKLEIMDTNGFVTHVINANKNNKIRGDLGYVMFTSSGQEVLVTCEDNSVRKLSLQGDVLASYSNTDLHGPRGIAVTGAGRVLVCDYYGHNVYICEDDKKIKTLLSHKDGLYLPWSLCVSAETNMLHVGCFGGVIKTYSLQLLYESFV